MDYGNTQPCDLLYTAGITAASCGGENSRHTWLLQVCFPKLTVVFQEHIFYISLHHHHKFFPLGAYLALGRYC